MPLQAEVKRGEARRFYVKQVEGGDAGEFERMTDEELPVHLRTRKDFGSQTRAGAKKALNPPDRYAPPHRGWARKAISEAFDRIKDPYKP